VRLQGRAGAVHSEKETPPSYAGALPTSSQLVLENPGWLELPTELSAPTAGAGPVSKKRSRWRRWAPGSPGSIPKPVLTMAEAEGARKAPRP